ncbi:calcium/proton exchanger [Pyricularia oryzae 70-15]|uniref:Calcium/proton exchanger n=1 Tax=Pyricularia oryzae (strain 70-15 / ATCC MYA-4617 / FGSC 8958) TaxID=242507 RepID=G4MWY2_PYRO7|nr:calcium/proton exchanger [Pyricularia oryzae 70-15]EHA54274.1 calcium/proton exchanger [Pyricularia oryzae 70-15]
MNHPRYIEHVPSEQFRHPRVEANDDGDRYRLDGDWPFTLGNGTTFPQPQYWQPPRLPETQSPGLHQGSISKTHMDNGPVDQEKSGSVLNEGECSIRGGSSQGSDDSHQDPSLLMSFLGTTRRILLSSYINVLLLFVPVGIVLGNIPSMKGPVIFTMNAIAIIPLAGLLSMATETMAASRGPAVGALMNITFGNAVELIIFVIALVKDEVRIVQASLLGSILANLLLILGMCFLLGGLRFREQVYNATATQTMACLLSLSVISLVLPTAFHVSFQDNALAKKRDVIISRITSIVLLIVYLLYLVFQLKTHSYLYKYLPQEIIDEESQPGPVAAFLHEDSSSDSSSDCSCSLKGDHSQVASKCRAVMRSLGKGRFSPNTSSSGVHLLHTCALAAHGGPICQSCPRPAPAVPIEDDGDLGSGLRPSIRPSTPQRRLPSLHVYGPSFADDSELPTRSSSAIGTNAAPENAPPKLAKSSFLASIGRSLTPTILKERPPSIAAGSVELVNPRHRPRSLLPANDPPEELLSTKAALILLVASTGLVAYCAELMVTSMSSMLATSPPVIGEAFIGLIVLPVVGNAAEHVTAITVALKNKMDLAIAVAVGSSIQIALFVTPFMVILGWMLERDMTLRFTLFETVCLFLATFIVGFLVLDGRSNYLEGALLLAAYVIVAVVAFYYPSQTEVGIVAG